MTASFNDTYEIKSLIGTGGMSTVYLAEHKRLHTLWAVKEVSKVMDVRFDFLAESNILKRLRHPMLPRIVDIFETEQYVYIVEDYVEGITLAGVLRQQQKVDEALALQWFKDLCSVLRYLHTQRPNPIIYRDMKPSNIMLQPDGTLKLIDFGIAREYKQDSAADTTYIGTKGYAAPEQFGKAQTDARTDIYSLGVTMYHLLSGKSPYEPPYKFVPIRELVPQLSAGIEYILDKCTQSEPENRYQNIDELLDDLENIFKFDKAWKRYKNAKRIRVIIIAVLLIASFATMLKGQLMIADERAEEAALLERESTYSTLLSTAAELYASDCEQALALLSEAQDIYPERTDAYEEYVYALYLNKEYQACTEYGEGCLTQFPDNVNIFLSTASAYFELAEYDKAAEYYYLGAQGSELTVEHMRDYAVCLGRMGEVEKAEEILNELSENNIGSEITTYVQGEIDFAQENYLEAESAFLAVLQQTDDESLLRRCYVSLGDLYRSCAALERVGTSPIESPASKSVALLSEALTVYGWRYDSVLWELLGMAYFEAYHTDPSVPQDYLNRAADCFALVIDLGMQKAYLYTNLYFIYYEMSDYTQAAEALDAYEAAFPNDYVHSALRGILLITVENEKPQNQRDYSEALVAYEQAGALITNKDDTTYYQQLASLIDSLKANGWL